MPASPERVEKPPSPMHLPQFIQPPPSPHNPHQPNPALGTEEEQEQEQETGEELEF